MLKINSNDKNKKKKIVNSKKEAQRKILQNLFKPKHLVFSLKYEPKFIEMLDEKLGFKNNNYYVDDKVPLFSIRSDEPETTFKNMQLVKLNIKCVDCDFEERISKMELDKLLRQQKSLTANKSKKHSLETNHKLIVKQSYEEYKPKRLLTNP